MKILVLLFLVQVAHCAEGLILYKTQNHQNDAYASVVEYKSIEQHKTATHFTDVSGKKGCLTFINGTKS